MVALPRLARFRTVMENRQSEFLQFSLFIAATIWLVQKAWPRRPSNEMSYRRSEGRPPGRSRRSNCALRPMIPPASSTGQTPPSAIIDPVPTAVRHGAWIVLVSVGGDRVSSSHRESFGAQLARGLFAGRSAPRGATLRDERTWLVTVATGRGGPTRRAARLDHWLTSARTRSPFVGSNSPRRSHLLA